MDKDQNQILEVKSTDVQLNFVSYQRRAEGLLGKPVMVLDDDKPSVVIIGATEYARLKKRDKISVAAEDLPEWMIELIANSEMDEKFAYLNKID